MLPGSMAKPKYAGPNGWGFESCPTHISAARPLLTDFLRYSYQGQKHKFIFRRAGIDGKLSVNVPIF